MTEYARRGRLTIERTARAVARAIPILRLGSDTPILKSAKAEYDRL